MAVILSACEKTFRAKCQSLSAAELEELRLSQHPLVENYFCAAPRVATGAPCDDEHALIHAQPQADSHEQPQASHLVDDSRESRMSSFIIFAKKMAQLYLVEPTTPYPPPSSQARPSLLIINFLLLCIFVILCMMNGGRCGPGLA